MKTAIKSVYAHEVYSLRGHPGIEAIVTTENGAVGVALCTAGLSIGTFEVPFVYDGGARFHGKGVSKAASMVNEIAAPALIGLDAAKQAVVDDVLIRLNSPEAKTPIGGNSTAAVSAAVLKAGAAALGIPLYQHIGGTHATSLPVPDAHAFLGSARYGGGERAYGKPSVEFVAYDFATFSEASYALWEISTAWRKLLLSKYGKYTQAEGSVVIDAGMFSNDEEIFKTLADVIAGCGFEGKVGIQIDAASDTYYNKENKLYEGIFNSVPKDRDAMIDYYKHLVSTLPIVILEDPLNEEDYDGHAILVKELGIQIVGDDLFTTNTERVKKGIMAGGANCVLLKVNQVGTITQASEMISLAYNNGYGVMPCQSRGEGVAIVDYCVGFGTGTVRGSGLFQFGNRFIDIEKELGSRVQFAGKHGLKGARFEMKSN